MSYCWDSGFIESIGGIFLEHGGLFTVDANCWLCVGFSIVSCFSSYFPCSIYLFLDSFITSIIHSLIRLIISSFIYSSIYSFIYLFNHLYNQSINQTINQSFNHSINYPSSKLHLKKITFKDECMCMACVSCVSISENRFVCGLMYSHHQYTINQMKKIRLFLVNVCVFSSSQ